jgi:hypothetical protein
MTCTWTPDFTEEQLVEWDELEEWQQERSLLFASSSLQMLTSYRVGTCPITIRPCPPIARCGCGWNPHIRDGRWYNDCLHGYACRVLSEVNIPGPVGFIDSMKIDGAEVELWNGDWRLDNGHLLVWQGVGASPIPEGQNLNRPDTEPGTWSITYSRSHPVSEQGRQAVAMLALEMSKAFAPKKKCSLPRGVTSVVRNGVSFTIEAGLFPGGLTGIDFVDQYITMWAPAGSPTITAKVFDPRDLGSPRRVSAVPQRTPLGSV